MVATLLYMRHTTHTPAQSETKGTRPKPLLAALAMESHKVHKVDETNLPRLSTTTTSHHIQHSTRERGREVPHGPARARRRASAAIPHNPPRLFPYHTAPHHASRSQQASAGTCAVLSSLHGHRTCPLTPSMVLISAELAEVWSNASSSSSVASSRTSRGGANVSSSASRICAMLRACPTAAAGYHIAQQIVNQAGANSIQGHTHLLAQEQFSIIHAQASGGVEHSHI